MTYNVVAAGIVAVALMLLTYPMARRAGEVDEDRRITTIIMIALALKLIASLARYWVAFILYDGSADAGVYLHHGEVYSSNMRQGDFSFDYTSRGGSDGTIFIRQLAGWVMFVTGPSRFAAFFVFSWFSFIGLLFFHRAFRLAVPDGDGRRYAYLIFLLPTLLYWPSSVGKEAWMLLTLGLGAYGVARILNNAAGGYVLIALALAGSAAVRPHMSVLLAGGLVIGFILRRAKEGSTAVLVRKAVGVVVVSVAMVFAVQAAEERFGVEGAGVGGAEEVIDRTAEQTAKGGSEFEARQPGSIVDLPFAVFTVLFRPLPFEAHNGQALLTSFEGVFLMILFLASWPRLRRLPRAILTNPYVAATAAYSVGFMLVFASFGNFGILARQRSQLFPFVLVLLCLPLVRPAGEQAAAAVGRHLGQRGSKRARSPVLVYLPSRERSSNKSLHNQDISSST